MIRVLGGCRADPARGRSEARPAPGTRLTGTRPASPRATAAGRPALEFGALACTPRGGLGRVLHRASIGTQPRPLSPMYSLSGLISLLSACCSMTCAVQPAIRLAEKTGVNRSVGMPR